MSIEKDELAKFKKGSVWGESEQQMLLMAHRLPYITATSEIIQNIFKRNFGNSEPVLEIGAGAGVMNWALPEEERARLIGIDLNLNPLKIQKESGINTPLVQANAYKLPFGDESFMNAVSLAAFDTMPNPLVASREVLRVLKPGGWFVHVQDLIPDVDQFLRDFQSKNIIPFPCERRGRKVAFALVRPESFNKKVLTTSGRKIIINFPGGGGDLYNLLVRYSNDPFRVHHEIYETLDGLDLGIALHNIQRALSAVKINPQISESTDVLFERKMIDSLQRARFSQVSVSYPEAAVSVETSEDFTKRGNNVFASDVGVWERSRSQGLADLDPHAVLIRSRVQVIAAQKNSGN